MSLIEREAAIDAIERIRSVDTYADLEYAKDIFRNIPSAQPEPSIPLSWIEEHIEWLKSLDNEFASLAAAHISVMVKKWRSEQDE